MKLLEWVKGAGMREVVVLTSSHAHERRDSQITGYGVRGDHWVWGESILPSGMRRSLGMG